MRDVVNRGRHLLSQDPFFLEATSGFQSKKRLGKTGYIIFVVCYTPSDNVVVSPYSYSFWQWHLRAINKH